LVTGVALALSAAAGAEPSRAKAPPQDRVYRFDRDQENGPPRGFDLARTGTGPAGRWVVLHDDDAPSPPRVLAQLDADMTADRVPIAVVQDATPKDFRARLSSKLISGKNDQHSGLVFRYRDENNYLLARADALEGNIRLYCVKNGVRRQIESMSGAVTGGVWHDLQVSVKNDLIEVRWDGEKMLRALDHTFGVPPGKIGVATKADSVTYFDDLSVSAI
jgi:hypothetical protein